MRFMRGKLGIKYLLLTRCVNPNECPGALRGWWTNVSSITFSQRKPMLYPPSKQVNLIVWSEMNGSLKCGGEKQLNN